jgi:hypothetical protein
LAISAVDTISLAFDHMKRQLFRPFRFGQWVRLAFVGLLAGELGTGGSFSGKSFNPPGRAGAPGSIGDIFHKIDPAILVTLIGVIIVTGIVFFIVMTYISSVMRFILFDGVLTRECHIRDGWNRRQSPAWKLFLWQLGLMLFTFAAAVLLIGVPAAFAFARGWFNLPRAHMGQLILTGILVFGAFAIFMIAIAVVHVFTKDFVVPQMALEDIGAIEGWRRLWALIQMEKGGYAVYVIMKIVLAVIAGIIVAVATGILAVIIAVPAVAAVVAVVVAGKSAGLTWNVFTITAAIVAGCILLLIFFFFVSLISVPVIVFFPAYAMYFFAGRYQPLYVALYPPPLQSPLPAPGTPPPYSPPPLPAT